MKKIILIILAVASMSLLHITCGPNPCGCAPPDFSRCADYEFTAKRIMSYMELKNNMKMKIILSSHGRYFNDKQRTLFSLQFMEYDFNTCTQKSVLSTALEDTSFIYPGPVRLTWDSSYEVRPVYASTYHQAKFDELSKRVDNNSNVHSTNVCMRYRGDILDGIDFDGLLLTSICLYNQLDSMKVVCLNKSIENHPPLSSLNDIMYVTLTRINKASEQSSEEANVYTTQTPLDSLDLGNSNQGTISVYSNPYDICGRNGAEKPEKIFFKSHPISFSFKEDVEKPASGEYTFKVYLYLDNGALTVESEELSVNL